MADVREETPIRVYSGTSPLRAYRLSVRQADGTRAPLDLSGATAMRLVVRPAAGGTALFEMTLATGLIIEQDGTEAGIDAAIVSVQYAAAELTAERVGRHRYALLATVGGKEDVVMLGAFVIDPL